MRIMPTFWHGAETGGVFGLVAAAASLLMGPPVFMAILPTLFVGSLLGGAAGGVLAVSTQILTSGVPGFANAIGKRENAPARQLPAVAYHAKDVVRPTTKELADHERNFYVGDHIRDQRDDWVERLEAERTAQNQDLSR